MEEKDPDCVAIYDAFFLFLSSDSLFNFSWKKFI